MADLDPLIRVRKHAVEEKQRLLAGLYRQAEELEKQKKAIAQQIEKEKQLSREMGTIEASAFLGLFIEGAKKKIRAIEKDIRQMETRIAIAQEDMRGAFAEMKKVEITQRSRKNREKADKNRKESQELDEIAIEQFRRKNKEEE